MIILKKSPEIIEKIISAQKLEDAISVSSFKEQYKNYLKLIHPDLCQLNGAKEATARMTGWKDFLENGKQYDDDCGIFKTNGYWVEYLSIEPNVKASFEFFKHLKSLNGSQAAHFNKYLPKGSKDQKLLFEYRAIPLSGLRLSQEHVNWLLNRLLEYCAYLEEIGYVHCGLNPESVFVVPETHGIQICSFYHHTKREQRIKTISAKYQKWYPSWLFDDNRAYHEIDIEMAKKIAAYLLGSPSGSAIPLRNSVHPEFVNFLVSHHENAHEAMYEYKKLLSKYFKSKFYLLNI